MKRTFKFSSLISVILFSAILASAFIQQAFHFLPELPNKENRKLSDKPTLSLSLLDPFPQQYESYYNDHFAYRNHLVKAYADISLDIFGKSPYPDQVIIGKKKNLFLVPNELATYMHTNLFSKQDLDKIRSEFIYRKAYFEKNGIDYYMAICPTKYTIYPELLPWYVKPYNGISRTDQFIDLLRSIGVQVIDLRKALITAKDSVPEELFLATDNHWNELGAFIGYREIMNTLSSRHAGLKILSTKDFQIKAQKRDGGNLASIINKKMEMPDVRYNFTPLYPNKTSMIQPCPFPIPVNITPSDYYSGFYMHDSHLPEILMIHDSFGKFIYPFFKDSFSKSTFIWDKWQYKINEPIVETEKPDIYITLCLESLLHGVADNCELRK